MIIISYTVTPKRLLRLGDKRRRPENRTQAPLNASDNGNRLTTGQFVMKIKKKMMHCSVVFKCLVLLESNLSLNRSAHNRRS